jgi:anti-anti-sigma factor
MTDFDVSTVKRSGRTTVFARGDIDLAVGELFRSALCAAQKESVDVIVDLTGVTFIDSTGINALIGAARNAGADRNRLLVVGARPSVRRVFEISGVDMLLLE